MHKNITLTDKVTAIAGTVADNIGFYSFDPDDRFYHADDNTWWRKDLDGRLVQAVPPPTSGLVEALHAARDWIAALDVPHSVTSAILNGIDDELAANDARGGK